MHDIHLIDPVSRIEGHAKITLRLDESGRVDDARFYVTEFRGFEDFCRGRLMAEMPALTARTCGICPVSHLIASAKAGDAIMAVAVPPTAERLRRAANLGQMIQSHALSFFHLSAPDLLLGMDADPSRRNVFGLMSAEPELVRRGIRLRQFGQEVIEAVAGSKIHGRGIVAGGVAEPLRDDTRRALAARLDEAKAAAVDTLELFIGLLGRFEREVAAFGSFPTLYLAHCGADGSWEHYDGHLRLVDAQGAVVAEGLAPSDYRAFLGEWVSEDSYLKSPYWKAAVSDGDPSPGMYRVGPLARLNVCERMGAPLADEALAAFRDRAGGVANSAFFYHYARLVEVLGCVELLEPMLTDPTLCDPHVRADAGINRLRGEGSSEAPRGTLFHDYEVDEHGQVQGVNMLIATGQNNLAMNRTVLQIAREWVTGPDIPEGVLNRIEAGLRAYDPCLSCSTHALGQMPFLVQVLGPDGEPLAEVRRD